MKLHELLEARAAVAAEMRAILDKAEAETRDVSTEESKAFDIAKAKLASLDKQIERAQALADAERAAPAVRTNGRPADGRYEERAREFSIRKAILAQLGDHTVDAGFERELSQEVVRRTGRAFEGFAAPSEALFVERRTLATNSDPSGGYVAPSTYRGDQFIDPLRSALVVERLGGTVLPDVVGASIEIPRQTTSITAQHVGEAQALTETDPAFGMLTLSPKTVGGLTSYTRRMLLNSSPAIDTLIRNDLAAVIARAIDYQTMFGPGASAQPEGIINNPDAYEATLAGPTWAQVLAFVAHVEHADAALAGLGWALNAHAAKKLRTTLKEAGDAGAGYVMEAPGMLAGYPAAVSSALPGDPATPTAGTVIFGAWSQAVLAYWSGIDILANPYSDSAFAKGNVQVRAMRDYDVCIRHGESFAWADDLTV